jgi:hypothetical protein
LQAFCWSFCVSTALDGASSGYLYRQSTARRGGGTALIASCAGAWEGLTCPSRYPTRPPGVERRTKSHHTLNPAHIGATTPCREAAPPPAEASARHWQVNRWQFSGLKVLSMFGTQGSSISGERQ